MKTWIEPIPTEVSREMREAVGGNCLLAEILERRGYSDPEILRGFLDPEFYVPTSSMELPGMEKAVDRLVKAIKLGEKILVWGDFDVDGQTSTSLLVSVLRELGARSEFHIPIRARESHGVNLPELKRLLLQEEKPSVVLTCDTGSTANDAVSYANSHGVDFVITDHHELPENLPEAVALVNPNILPSNHPLRTLPGVGVAYKLAEELLSRFDKEEFIDWQLDLVAMGIIADVATLYGDTRYLAQRGLSLLRNPHRVGLQAIFELADVNPGNLTEENIGYAIAPRLNAIGRLDDANPVVELLTTNDRGKAKLLALQLEVFNRQRQLLTDQVYRAALQQIENDRALLNSAVLVLSYSTWPAGIIGIVASRLVERFGKPTILISTLPGEKGRGSARSVEGVDITAAIASQTDLLDGFGGHPMAAGFSIDPTKIPYFRQGISHFVEKEGIPPVSTLKIDSYLEWNELDLNLVNSLERLAPFGPGNPPIIFASRGLILSKKREVGRNKEHLLLSFVDKNGLEKQVIWWNGAIESDSLNLPDKPIDLAYMARTSNYRGKPELGIQFVDYRYIGSVEEVQDSKTKISFIDFRSIQNPFKKLRELWDEDIQVWAEGGSIKELTGFGIANKGRNQLCSGEKLVIWTTPPSSDEVQRVIKTVSPSLVIVFAIDPPGIKFDAFLERLMGIVKFAIRKQNGHIRLNLLAELAAASELSVRIGLEWLTAKGYIQWDEIDEEGIVLKSGVESNPSIANELLDQLKILLSQAEAYRAFFQRANLEEIYQKSG